MTYASETWTLSKKMENKLKVAQHNMERSMLNITLKDKKTNHWIREQTRGQDIIHIIKLKKWSWAGHISRIQDQRWTTEITTWTPRDGGRSQGKPLKRWRDEIDTYTGTVNWQQMAQNRQQWRSHAEAFIQQWIELR